MEHALIIGDVSLTSEYGYIHLLQRRLEPRTDQNHMTYCAWNAIFGSWQFLAGFCWAVS